MEPDQTKTTILDMDSTIVHCIFRKSLKTKQEKDLFDNIESYPNYNEIKDRIFKFNLIDSGDDKPKGIGKIDPVLIILRPYTRIFLAYLKEVSTIHIWSAGYFRYVRLIESVLFPPEHGYRTDKVMTRRDCILTENGVNKNLKRKCYDESSTIIIDDRVDICNDNKDNSILIPGFEPNFDIESLLVEDNCLLLIMKWMKANNFKDAEDVRTLNKSIFTG